MLLRMADMVEVHFKTSGFTHTKRGFHFFSDLKSFRTLYESVCFNHWCTAHINIENYLLKMHMLTSKFNEHRFYDVQIQVDFNRF